jgi:SAM-dependent methyltransferase
VTTDVIDEGKLGELTEHVSNHAAGAMGVVMAYLGDKLGLYQALADGGPMSSHEVAAATGTSERYVREWLSSNAAGGYVQYDAASQKFHMTPEQTLVFARDGQPGCMQGIFQSIVAAYLDEPRNTEVFQSGEGIPWGDKNLCCFCGTERFFRPMYEANLLSNWIPALDGIQEKLQAGSVVADVGCGHGLSTTILAKAFPNSMFYGYDYHPPSIDKARDHAAAAGVSNAFFDVAGAKDYPARDYDLVAIFDALHDMGDPVGVSRYVRDTLKDDGTFMLIEPMAADALEDNLHSGGQMFYAFSTLTCTAVSLSQEVGLALGAQAGPSRLSGVLQDAGFSNVRLACGEGTNLVLEATP